MGGEWLQRIGRAFVPPRAQHGIARFPVGAQPQFKAAGSHSDTLPDAAASYDADTLLVKRHIVVPRERCRVSVLVPKGSEETFFGCQIQTVAHKGVVRAK